MDSTQPAQPLNLQNLELTQLMISLIDAVRSPFDKAPWTDYTPTITGFSGTPTINSARYKLFGKTVILEIDFIGTSNNAGMSFSLPVASKTWVDVLCRCQNNGGISASPSLLEISPGGSVANLYADSTGNPFVASGTKRLYGTVIMYEAI